ncbi:hypothetical protein J6590_031120 [Homalodisca vitripennis]|nr:hypothetical protein J6590_031120 [Homalodisca vitripennis]
MQPCAAESSKPALTLDTGLIIVLLPHIPSTGIVSRRAGGLATRTCQAKLSLTTKRCGAASQAAAAICGAEACVLVGRRDAASRHASVTGFWTLDMSWQRDGVALQPPPQQVKT